MSFTALIHITTAVALKLFHFCFSQFLFTLLGKSPLPHLPESWEPVWHWGKKKLRTNLLLQVVQRIITQPNPSILLEIDPLTELTIQAGFYPN